MGAVPRVVFGILCFTDAERGSGVSITEPVYRYVIQSVPVRIPPIPPISGSLTSSILHVCCLSPRRSTLQMADVDLTRLDQTPFYGMDVTGAAALAEFSDTSKGVTQRMMAETVSLAYYLIARAEQYPHLPTVSLDAANEVFSAHHPSPTHPSPNHPSPTHLNPPLSPSLLHLPSILPPCRSLSNGSSPRRARSPVLVQYVHQGRAHCTHRRQRRATPSSWQRWTT